MYVRFHLLFKVTVELGVAAISLARCVLDGKCYNWLKLQVKSHSNTLMTLPNLLQIEDANVIAR